MVKQQKEMTETRPQVPVGYLIAEFMENRDQLFSFIFWIDHSRDSTFVDGIFTLESKEIEVIIMLLLSQTICEHTLLLGIRLLHLLVGHLFKSHLAHRHAFATSHQISGGLN